MARIKVPRDEAVSKVDDESVIIDEQSITEVETPAEDAPTATTTNSLEAFFKKPLHIAVVVFAVLIVGLMIYLIQDRNNLRKQLNGGSAEQTIAEAQQLKQEVGQVLELPSDETPTVATVSDVSKLQNQSFFANAQNNDKVLLFPKAGKAVLYRQSTKKVVEVAPINLNNQDAGSGQGTN